jgi:hypothetical protein
MWPLDNRLYEEILSQIVATDITKKRLNTWQLKQG